MIDQEIQKFAYLDGFGARGNFTKSVIIVTAPTGSTVTCSNGSIIKNATEKKGEWRFNGLDIGQWTITATLGEQSSTKKINITEFGVYRIILTYFAATIQITYEQGAICTCSKDNRIYTAPDTSGYWECIVDSAGEWMAKITKGEEFISNTVTITENGEVKQIQLFLAKIFGIKRNITVSSPEWTRTDDAIGMTATASVGTSAGHSDFDNVMPWKGIEREILSVDSVVVKIPKFYYRRYREKNIEYIKIADKYAPGFTLHPAFYHGEVESDYIYVGAYKGCIMNKIASGLSPMTSMSRKQFRNQITQKGEGWGLLDISTLSAIQMLILVEFANNDVQDIIGKGYCEGNSSALNTGSCDNVPNLTGRPAGTDGKTGVVYRGIEDFWGNLWEWIDGINWYDGDYYICNDQSKYADDVTEGYTKLSYKGETYWSDSYITDIGVDDNNSHIMLPIEASGGTSSTYMCDVCSYSTGWRVASHNGMHSDGSSCGLFTVRMNQNSSATTSSTGYRAIYIPPKNV